jgi:hypothetical protein
VPALRSPEPPAVDADLVPVQGRLEREGFLTWNGSTA